MAEFGHSPATTEDLRTLDEKWRAILTDEGMAPLLGLAPLEVAECEALKAVIDRELRLSIPLLSHRIDGLIRLLARYPAAVAVWLSRVAGEAYQEGNFWDHFAAQLQCIDVPNDRRAQFAAAFRRACRAVMIHFVPPEPGNRKYAGEFLFQAGLPLCHCGRFADALRTVTEAYGLPEPDDFETLREVRDAMVARSEVRQAPVVRQALEAESGLHLLAAAVRAVREDAFASINPPLGKRLRESFATAGAGLRQAAVRRPWLRLEEDFTSFAIIGPRQPATVLSGSGVRWVVDGATHRVGVEDEFIFPVIAQERLRVELLGLVGGRPLQRDFALHPRVEP